VNADMEVSGLGIMSDTSPEDDVETKESLV
jgi:hypothetical protein